MRPEAELPFCNDSSFLTCHPGIEENTLEVTAANNYDEVEVDFETCGGGVAEYDREMNSKEFFDQS